MVQVLNILNVLRRRPYRVECTGSLPTPEVKRRDGGGGDGDGDGDGDGGGDGDGDGGLQ
jgi:hypothetical protein